MNRLNLTTLNLVALIADSGSLKEAARKASLTTAAVSKRLLELEDQLQVPLFRRHGKGVTPTDAGRAVVAQGRQLLFDFERLQEQLNEFRIGRLGTVRLGANASAMTQFVPEDLARFFALHPDIRVDLRELPSDQIIDRLTDGRLDLGLFAERRTPTPVQVFPYRTHRLCAVVRKDSELARRKRVSFEDISKLPIIGLEGGSTLLQLLQHQSPRALNVPVQVRSFDVLCRFVQAGLGVGVLPERTAAIYAAAMALVPLALTDDWAHRTTLIGARSFDALSRVLPDRRLRPGAAGEREDHQSARGSCDRHHVAASRQRPTDTPGAVVLRHVRRIGCGHRHPVGPAIATESAATRRGGPVRNRVARFVQGDRWQSARSTRG